MSGFCAACLREPTGADCRRGCRGRTGGWPSGSWTPRWSAELALYEGFLAGVADPHPLVDAILASDPDGPAPAPQHLDEPASLADVRRVMSPDQWHWTGFLPAAHLGHRGV